MKLKFAQTTVDGQRGVSVIAARPTHQSEGQGAIPMTPHLVRAAGPSKGICDKITDDWHSYVKSTERGGRAVDYLIYGKHPGDEIGEIVGTIGFAFLGLRIPTPLAKAFSMGQVRVLDVSSMIKARRVAACFRYTLMSHVPKNFASQAIGASLRLLKRDWFQKYEAQLLGVVTFVKPPWTGSCFKAANFKMVGYTSGNPITYSTSHHRQGILQDDQLYILVYKYGGWPKAVLPQKMKDHGTKETKLDFDLTESSVTPANTSVTLHEGRIDTPGPPTSDP